MLILTRKVGEAVMIGNDVKITVLHVKGSQIRLGIDAPSTVAVHREEIFSRIQSSQLTQAVPIVPSLHSAYPAGDAGGENLVFALEGQDKTSL